jgi:5-methyltetrahydropteroyltriglutamate--homocysteine methyltransferase
LSSEPDRPRVLKAAKSTISQVRCFSFGVTDRINPRWETPEEIRDRVLEATRIIPVESLGTTDDCGFSAFADDTSTTRDTAFAKVKSRVEGTLMASNILKV